MVLESVTLTSMRSADSDARATPFGGEVGRFLPWAIHPLWFVVFAFSARHLCGPISRRAVLHTDF